MSASAVSSSSRRQRAPLAAIFASLILHGALLYALLMFVWWPQQDPEDTPVVVPVVSESPGEGATGAGAGSLRATGTMDRGADNGSKMERQEAAVPPDEAAAVPVPPEPAEAAPVIVPFPTLTAAPTPLPPAPPQPLPRHKPRPPVARVAEATPAPPPPAPQPIAPRLAAAAGEDAAAEAAAAAGNGKAGPGGLGEGETGTGRGLVGPGRASCYDDDYLTSLAKHLNRYKKPVDGLKRTAEVAVGFELARDGTLLSAEIDESSNDPVIDQTALAIFRAASPLPKIPDRCRGEGPFKLSERITWTPALLDRLFQ